MRDYPPRLPDQPIFYPVLNEAYATQIASEWNTKVYPYAGYVTRFEVDDDYAREFEVHIVGGRTHQELWVSADQLAEFNAQIRGPIQVTAGYFGAEFEGHIPSTRSMLGMSATQQIQALAASRDYAKMDFYLETRVNELSIFLNFPFWLSSPPAALDLAPEVVAETPDLIRKCWDMGGRIAPLIERAARAA